MAFKIKDLLINIASSEPAGGEGGCVRHTDTGGCVRHTNTGCAGQHSAVGGCVRHTDTGCTAQHSAIGFCVRHTDTGCVGQHSDVGFCVRHTDTGFVGCGTRLTGQDTCVGRHTNVTGCGHRYTGPGGGDPGELLEDLNLIKAQLQAALAEVDEEITTIEDTLRPKTLEEVDQIQTKLKEALEELDKIKADLDKK
jgi:hypothetical protein